MPPMNGLDETARRTLPFYQIEWSDDACVWAVSPVHAPHVQEGKFTSAITVSKPLLFEIIAPAENVDSVSVLLFAHQDGVSHPTWCELTDASGEILAFGTASVSGTGERPYKILDLRDVPLAVGAKYCVHLQTAGAPEEPAVSAWTVEADAGCILLPLRIIAFRSERHFVYPDTEDPPTKAAGARCLIALPRQVESFHNSAILQALTAAFPDQDFDVVELDGPATYWPLLSSADAVIFAGIDQDADPRTGFEALCFALHRRGVCTISFLHAGTPDPRNNPTLHYKGNLGARKRRLQEAMRRCHFYLTNDLPAVVVDSMTNKSIEPAHDRNESGAPSSLEALIAKVRQARLPRVAIVSVLYRKADVVDAFIDHIVRQSYPGEISIVLVDDCSPENDAFKTKLYQTRLGALEAENRRIITIANESNLGNCASRLAGLAAHEADIYVVVDCDCLLNRDFVAAHVFEHAWPDVDVVIGPLNIESHGEDASDLIRELEAFPDGVAARAEPQDPLHPDGFLNCITRNFSIKHRCLASEPLFDLDFSYSRKPSSGFGWEDVEMGYRLYKRGAVIRFTPEAFSVHCSHPSSIDDTVKVAGSMRNFERLFVKHPEMALVVRRWAVDTYEKLISWAAAIGFDGGEVQRSLESRFSSVLEEKRDLIPIYRGKRRPLRILTYRWHVPHQYELYKLPHSFTLATGSPNGTVNSWSFDQRPLRPNARMLPMSAVDPRDFDLAILHFDENVLDPALCNGVIPPSWGDPFKWLLAIPDLPKIAICHGTPQFHGQYALDPARKMRFDIYEEERIRLVEALSAAGAHVVCNSQQALAEWGFRRSRSIWHGFDPQEFPPATYERDVLALEPDRHRPHYRGAWEHEEVARRLDPEIRIETAHHRGVAIEIRQSNAFAAKNFRSYVDRIRQFTAYLNTTLRSPMPRSRGEAMMTGVIPVCLDNHDVSLFIRPGINGFYSSDPGELADFINYLCRNREEARRVGAAARHTALDLFNLDRYLDDWSRLIKEVVA
jgi:glycosyltransferase involved in cell wall biosynthesis